MKTNPNQLLELDPDKLFREHTVTDLQNVQKQLHNEIEKKREELRTTVGERYRDLLKAADTIADMRKTVSEVVTRIQSVTTLTQSLQQKHLMGIKNDNNYIAEKLYSSENISKVLEVKLLTTLPERIWTAIDEKKLVEAAELYLFSEHTHLNLTVSFTDKQYPIVDNLWTTIVTCRDTILATARKRLMLLDLSMEISADCLSSILLLEPKTVLDVLCEYFELRQVAFQEVLITDGYPTVKEKLHAAVAFVQHTFLVTCTSFSDFSGRKCLIEEIIHQLSGDGAHPTVSKLPPVSPLAGEYLSELVKGFVPRTQRPVASLQVQIVGARLKAWFHSVQNILKSEMRNLLGLVESIDGIVSVRNKVSGGEKSALWAPVVELVVGPWETYQLLMEPHVITRTRQLIGQTFCHARTALTNAVAIMDEEFLKDNKNGRNQPENNIKWLLWKDAGNDEVGLQVSGYTHRVVSLCSVFESCLRTLMEDVNTYITATNTDATNKAAIIDHLSLSAFENIKTLTESLQEPESLQHLSESSFIMRARLLQALGSLSPSLRRCVQPTHASSDVDGAAWERILEVLSSANQALWRIWIQQITPQLHEIINDKMDSNVSVSAFLLSRPACEVVTITEQTENDEAVSSQLRVPCQPSFGLQEALMQICLRINAVAVHTLPRTIHQEIINTVIERILDNYERLSQSQVIYQSHAWQLVLDVRLLALLFLLHNNQTRAQTLAARFEAVIDPFDLKVCYPYLQVNIKKCAIRLQGTFGVLVDHTEKLAVLNSMKVSSGVQMTTASEDPVVLAVTSSVPWFPLLPISSSSGSKKELSPGRQNKPKTSKDSRKETTSSDFVKTAGAFFGAMTGGWT